MLSPKRMRRCRAARAVVSTRAARRLTDVAPLDPAHPMPLADALRVQAKVCRQMGAPFYSALSERLAGDVAAGGPTATLLAAHRMTTVEAAVPLRLLGGVHRLVLAGLAPELSVHFPSTGGDGDAEGAWPALRALLAGAPRSSAGSWSSPGTPVFPYASSSWGRARACTCASTGTGTKPTGWASAIPRRRCAFSTCGTPAARRSRRGSWSPTVAGAIARRSTRPPTRAA